MELFPVAREKLFRSDGVDSQYDALYRGDTGEQLSVVGRDYQLVTHQDAIEKVQETLDSMGENFDCFREGLTNRGKKLYAEYKLTNHEFDVDGDGMIPTLVVENSIDRSKSFRSRFGLYRLVCSNGLVVPVKEVQNLRFVHYMDNVDLDQVAAGIKAGLVELKDNFKHKFQKLNNENIAKNDVQKFLEDQSFPVAFKIEVAQAMIDQNLAMFEYAKTSNIEKPVEVDMGTISAYAWLNVLTYVATHKIQSLNKRIKIDSMISDRYYG